MMNRKEDERQGELVLHQATAMRKGDRPRNLAVEKDAAFLETGAKTKQEVHLNLIDDGLEAFLSVRPFDRAAK